MKYLVFSLVALVGVPIMAALSASSSKLRGLLLALLLFTPILGSKASINFVSHQEYRGPDRGFEVTITDLIATGLAIGLVARDFDKVAWIPRNTLVMVAYFLSCFFSALVSPMPMFSFFSVWKLVRCAVIYWATANCIRTGTPLFWVRRAWVAVGLCITFLVIKQKYMDGIYRVPGPFEHSNTIPLYCNLIIPLLFLWALADEELSPTEYLLTMAAAGGMTVGIVATFSRLGMALVGVAILSALAWSNLRFFSGRSAVCSLLVLAGMVAVGIKASDSIIRRIQNAPKASAQARHEFNYAAKLMAGDHSVGVGINMFSHVMSVTPRYRAHVVAMGSEEHSGVCHHIYWLTASELGYLGLGTYLSMILSFLGLALIWALWTPSLESGLLFGVFLGYMTLQVSGFYEWAWRITPVTYQYFLVCGFVAGLADLLQERSRRRSRPQPRPRPEEEAVGSEAESEGELPGAPTTREEGEASPGGRARTRPRRTRDTRSAGRRGSGNGLRGRSPAERSARHWRNRRRPPDEE